MKKYPTLIFGRIGLIILVTAGPLASGAPSGRSAPGQDQRATLQAGAKVYRAACINCHGPDGKGVSQSIVGFTQSIRDFTDCKSTAREPDSDWLAVVTLGGPARGFSELMPAFDKALTADEIEQVVAYLRTFCPGHAWPRGDLNLPRAFFTEKAFPEDEAVLTSAVNTKGPGLITNAIVYEQRLGARNQFEVKAPFGWQRTTAGDGTPDWTSNLGDIALGVKHVLYHSFERGSILSAGAEIIMPTGDEAQGFGSGTFIFEPFFSFGQVLPADFFLHAQAGAELPFQTEKAEGEGYFKLALGRSFDSGRWGRSWSPIVELLAVRELAAGALIDLDIVPQLQVTLNKRKNIMASVGVRFPLNHTAGRSPQVVFYLLWDWFDGTLFEGW